MRSAARRNGKRYPIRMKDLQANDPPPQERVRLDGGRRRVCPGRFAPRLACPRVHLAPARLQPIAVVPTRSKCGPVAIIGLGSPRSARAAGRRRAARLSRCRRRASRRPSIRFWRCSADLANWS
jgi:hypothetical protein